MAEPHLWLGPPDEIYKWLNIDDTDRKLLERLQRNGRTSYAELGKVVGLSISSVNERVRKLQGSRRHRRRLFRPVAGGATDLTCWPSSSSDGPIRRPRCRSWAHVAYESGDPRMPSRDRRLELSAQGPDPYDRATSKRSSMKWSRASPGVLKNRDAHCHVVGQGDGSLAVDAATAGGTRRATRLSREDPLRSPQNRWSMPKTM